MGIVFNDPTRAALRYLYCSEEETRILEEKNSAKDYLKQQLYSLGEPDENGNLVWYFDIPLTLTGDTYSGLMLQRRVSEYTDEDLLLEIIRVNHLEDRCINRVVIEDIDLDEVYACNQEGLITDEEIDSVIVVKENWALVKVK